MTPITIALLLSALPAALAYPKHLGFGHAAVHARGTGHRHHSGSSSGPYGEYNSTVRGPTGTGTGFLFTVTVSPLPQSTESTTTCTSSTVTTTTTNRVTVTVQPSSAAAPKTASSTSIAISSSSVFSASSPISSSSTISSSSVFSASSIASSSSAAAPVVPTVYSSSSASSAVSALSASSSSSSLIAYTSSAVSTSTTYAQSSSASSTLAASSTSTSVISSTSAPASTAIAAPKTAASSSTTSSSATATPSSYSPPTGTKRGLVYNTASLTDAFASAPIDWAYNWAASTSGLPSQFEFVPMLWGLGSHTEGWTAAASSAISSGSGYLLGFNEPDMSLSNGGSDLSPADAVTGWNANMQQFAGGATKLGSPAVTNGGAPTGLTWLGEFVQQCSGCQIDFLNIHWYCGSGDSVANAVADFKDHVGKAVTQANGKPVWITEFRYVGSGSETDFIDQVLPWLDATGGVGRYSYFMASDNLLLSGSGLSATGEAYVSA